MKLVSVRWLAAIVAAFVCQLSIQAAEELRVGIFGDWQISNPARSSSASLLKDIFTSMKNLGVDAVMMTGDVASGGQPEVYEFFMKTYNEVFADKKPELLMVMGNHDFRNKKYVTREEKLKVFMDAFKMKELDYVRTVKGYKFVAFNPTSTNGEQYTKEHFPRFQKMISGAIKDSGNKPVFVFSHFPAYNTVYGSVYGKGAVTEILKPFSKIVYISGHSHWPIADDKSIYQNKYTAFQTGTTSWTELEPAFFNRKKAMSSGYGKARCFLYMTVNDKEIKVRRFDVSAKREIKPNHPWIISLPLDPATYKYTKARAGLNRKAPEFPAKAAGEAVPVKGGVKLVFDAAKHDDFVHSYALHISQWDGKAWQAVPVKKELLFCSDFFLGIEKMKKRYDVEIPAATFQFEAGKRYQLEIIPIESYGKRGKGIFVEYNAK